MSDTIDMCEYKDGDTIYILLKAAKVRSLLSDWLERNYQCDLQVCRSRKTPGCVVVKTKDIMWASCIVRWYEYEKVDFRHEG